MKIRAVLLAAALVLALQTGSARAALVDFTSTNAPGSYTLSGDITGGATATFLFTVAGASFSNLSATLSGNAGSLAPINVTSSPFAFGISSVAENSNETFSTSSLSYFFANGTNTTTPVVVSPVVIASANILGASQGEVTITNSSPLAASFSAILNYAHGLGFGQLLSSSVVATVPLPASSILFVAGILALAAFARFRKLGSNV